MKKIYATIFFIFIILFLFRIHQTGGIHDFYSQNDEVMLWNLRSNLENKVTELLPQPQAGLLSGMLLGVKSDLTPDFKLALQNTSTIHVAVVSGQNLTLVAGFFLSLASFIGRKKAIVLSTMAIFLYLFLTGFQAPSIRAAIMVSLAGLAQILGKNRESPWILVLTGAAMLLWNPNWLISISFQLSFLATFGVIVVAPKLMEHLKFLPDIIKQDIAISTAAYLLTWPIIAFNFHQLSLIGIVANSAVLWTVSFIMISGAAALAISFLSLFLAHIAVLIPGVFLTYFVYLINFTNSLPFSSIRLENLPFTLVLGYYLFIVSGLLTLTIKHQQQLSI